MAANRIGAVAFSALFLTAMAGAHAKPTETVLFAFEGATGVEPYGELVADTAGNFYGGTLLGGPANPKICPSTGSGPSVTPGGCGIVFELSPPKTGEKTWTETVLHNFAGPDGTSASGNLVRDKAGNLYGITASGGPESASCPGNLPEHVYAGCGVIFELSPPPAGKKAWTETILHSFSGPDGSAPAGGLAVDKAGNLYGVTNRGGTLSCRSGSTTNPAPGCGTVFKLAAPAPGKKAWVYSALYKFGGGASGTFPASTPTLDAEGNLYGTTATGGGTDAACPADKPNSVPPGCGVAYKLAPPKSGKGAWTETVLYAFPGGTGPAAPYASLIFDKAGNLYGTTSCGGPHATNHGTGSGTVFELSPPAAGKSAWAHTILHDFTGSDLGTCPWATLLLDKAGALDGTLQLGGSNNLGGVFKLSPPKAGKTAWTAASLYQVGFDKLPAGVEPLKGLIQDATGNLYGTMPISVTTTGSQGGGTVFKITP